MSSRRRKSESLWDTKEEEVSPAELSGSTPLTGKELHSSAHGDTSPKWSISEANDVVMSDDISGQFSWDPLQGNGNMPKDDDISGDKHGMQTDPDFDERENQFGTRPSDDNLGMPCRGRDRGVGGTGNMSRDRDRSRSRSRSPKRSRGKMRGMARSRSRSRGRDRGRTWENSRARSRSPSHDDRRESYEFADVKNDSRVSSRLCKDFAAGNCRRGSQCRFFHQEIPNSRDGGNRMDNDSVERSSRPQYAGGLRHGDNRNSADVTRNRFPDDYDRGDRNVYDDQDRRRQSRRNTGVPCKFFAAGKCSRNDCKYSHDIPESGGYDGRSRDNIRDPNPGSKSRTWNDRQPQDDSGASRIPDFPKADRNVDDKNMPWNDPSWDDVESGGIEKSSCDDFQGQTLDDKMRTRDHPLPQDASGFSDIPKPSQNYKDHKKSWNGTSRDKISALGFSIDAKSNKNIDRKRKSWDEVGESGYTGAMESRGQEVGSLQTDSKSKKWDAPEWNEQASRATETLDIQKPQLISDSSRLPSNPNVAEQSSMFNGSVQNMFMQNNDGGKPLEALEIGVQVTHAMNSEQVLLVSSLPRSLPQTSQVGQLPQAYSELNLTNTLGLLYSLPISASSGPPTVPMPVQQNLDIRSKEQYEPARNTEANKSVKTSVPMDVMSNSVDPNSRKLGAVGARGEEHGKISKSKKQEQVENAEGNESRVAENPKHKQENVNPGNSDAQGKVEEVNISSDEKAMRLFKVALVEFVKEILKPTWKEGKMSREVHKTIVKKVVDKVTSTIQGIQIPRTQERIDQYLEFSKSKITKLVEAYVERSLKA